LRKGGRERKEREDRSETVSEGEEE